MSDSDAGNVVKALGYAIKRKLKMRLARIFNTRTLLTKTSEMNYKCGGLTEVQN